MKPTSTPRLPVWLGRRPMNQRDESVDSRSLDRSLAHGRHPLPRGHRSVVRSFVWSPGAPLRHPSCHRPSVRRSVSQSASSARYAFGGRRERQICLQRHRRFTVVHPYTDRPTDRWPVRTAVERDIGGALHVERARHRPVPHVSFRICPSRVCSNATDRARTAEYEEAVVPPTYRMMPMTTTTTRTATTVETIEHRTAMMLN